MRKPNFLFILMDDLGWRDLSCYGSSFYETPNLDRLAAQGMQFSDAYASCPVCSPTRASVMTGKYPATVGITDWIDWGGHCHPRRGKLVDVPYLRELPPTEKTLASALSDGGYRTWHVGKWHLGGPGHSPEDFGFDVNVGGCEDGSPGGGGYFSPWSIRVLKDADVPDGTYLTDYLTDKAVELIEQDDDRPFFLNMWYYSVHTPIQAKPEKIRKYEAKARELGLDRLQPHVDGGPLPYEDDRNRHIMRRIVQSDPVYAGMVESMDENIGRLLTALERTGKADNTVVVFTSDNGGLSTTEGSPTCNAPLSEGKGWMYEGGTREPLIVRWPGVVQPGSTCNHPVTSTDFYPTFLEAAALAPIPEQHCDGASILPLLRQTGQPDREAIFWHYPHYGNQGGTPGSSVRSGDHKLIEFFEDGTLELYNVRNDISEKNNLAESKPTLTRRLADMLATWRESVEAKIPQINTEYHR